MNGMKKLYTGKKAGIILIILGFLGAAVFIVMASTLNPWSMKLPHLDSAVWLRCAVGMKQGETLYVDVWDHKGPVLFAIQYLGLTLTPHSLTGIWLLECLCIFLLLWSFYLVAGLISDSRLVRYAASVLSLHSFYYFYHITVFRLKGIYSGIIVTIRNIYTKMFKRDFILRKLCPFYKCNIFTIRILS